MRVLLINKFLHPNGGSETYVFRLGQALTEQGHQVEYFGMDHPRRQVGNRVECYTKNMDFHRGGGLGQLLYPVKTIYSAEARRKLRQVLEDFQPQVCHLNNFHYQLTPSIILEIRSWERQRRIPCAIVYTAHDPQLVCPNHQLRNPQTGQVCEACLEEGCTACLRNRCIHGSLLRSALGTAQALFWDRLGVYRQVDGILCCSEFLKGKLDTHPVLREKTRVLPNFVERRREKSGEKGDYVLYFGRYAQEKGVALLTQVCRSLPDIPFVFAGSGPLAHLVAETENIDNRGFLQGEALESLIRGARFTVCPSVCYENCPYSILESLELGTPVLGADIGGIPERILPGQTGELFESGNPEALRQAIRTLWDHPERTDRYARCCARLEQLDAGTYTREVLAYYQQIITRRASLWDRKN